MHILLVFFIGIGLLGGFHARTGTPEGVLDVAPAGEGNIRLHQAVTPASQLQNKGITKQTYDYSCGSAALATLLNSYIGEELSERQVIAGLLRYGNKENIKQRRAFSLLDMKKFVQVLGYKGVGYQASLDDLLSLQRPCIIPITVFGYRHFVVFKGIHQGHIFFADPWWGNTSYPLAQFENNWYRHALFMVYPKQGASELKALRLKEEDLRFIDEDMAMSTIFNRRQAPSLTSEWQRDRSLTGDTVIQTKRVDGYRVVQE
jgi:predicted double-glycine peptidase